MRVHHIAEAWLPPVLVLALLHLVKFDLAQGDYLAAGESSAELRNADGRPAPSNDRNKASPRQAETNSLIESGTRLEPDRSSIGKSRAASSVSPDVVEQQQQQGLKHSDARNIMLAQDRDKDWCHEECPRWAESSQVCASNGRLFGSICELRRFSCLHNMHLMAKPKAYCLDSAKSDSEVRVVELRRACNRAEYERMKLLLVADFNGDLVSMFNYLDSNSNGLVEAHELWPKTSEEEKRSQIYAQLWSNHLVNCSQVASQAYHFLQDHSKCWFFLDFAFEPQYPPNPCSLSHLMLFEAPDLASRRALAGSAGLALDTFKRAFAKAVASSARRRPQHGPGWQIRTPVSAPLGASLSLSCLDKLASANELELDLSEVSGKPKCQWTRYGSSLATLKDPHLVHSSDLSVLHLRDAQLYLSGPYKCECRLDMRSAQVLERIFEVQVVAAPHVEVRPELQWALAGSSAAFDCLYDYVDTRNGLADPSGRTKDDQFRPELKEADIRLEWFKEVDANERWKLATGSSRLSLESLQQNDSSSLVCSIGVEGGPIEGQARARLEVQARPGELVPEVGSNVFYLWVFHESGISVYRLPRSDGQEMELLREISGHSQVDAEVDGNWNQLTLCGGLNPDQVVICEWSDNALLLDADGAKVATSPRRRYVYVGQPNLNRVVVFDAEAIAIVAIINTEPQPRKLFLYKPNKVHLSKWVRRRLSPAASARWLTAVGEHAHALELTAQLRPSSAAESDTDSRARRRQARRLSQADADGRLVQLDIWLLCYGQPLVLDPDSDQRSNEATFYLAESASNHSGSVLPFAPRLSSWPAWPNKEWRLRNRKSVHIIQSTFLPQSAKDVHRHSEAEADSVGAASPVARFERSTVLTTHHILASPKAPAFLDRARPDLVQDLMVPERPKAFASEPKFKLHHAYVSHYDERRLFRVSMDEYRYERELDLQDCDPLSLVASVQGLLVVQCRAAITHDLIGQLVLDELTGAKIEFNAHVRAQESFLSPDNRYLLSIHTNFSSEPATRHATDRPQHRQSLIYVQLVTVDGLLFQYQIKSTLEIEQCAFVWRDGYYAAILVSSNHQEDHSELLSLRLADSRLELLARVPGTVGPSGRKEQLLVAGELRLAALATNRGTFVVDLEDNRVSQSLRRHQSPPTMLWV